MDMARNWSRTGAVFALLAMAPGTLAQTSAQKGEWGQLLDWGIQGKHMVLLTTGDVLVWSTGESARVWNPQSGGFTLTPATFGDLHCAGQVTMSDGRVIVLGGVNGDRHVGRRVSAIFGALVKRWNRGRPMTLARWSASVRALRDGGMLVCWGGGGLG